MYPLDNVYLRTQARRTALYKCNCCGPPLAPTYSTEGSSLSLVTRRLASDGTPSVAGCTSGNWAEHAAQQVAVTDDDVVEQDEDEEDEEDRHEMGGAVAVVDDE